MSQTILHAEDEPSLRLLVRLLFQKVMPEVTVHSVADGQQALDYLTGRGAYADRDRFPLPQLVLLDLDMPVLSGFEVLTWARVLEQFETLPMVALSSFALPEDFGTAKRLGATHCFRKTARFEDVMAYARDLFAALAEKQTHESLLASFSAEPGSEEKLSLAAREEVAC